VAQALRQVAIVKPSVALPFLTGLAEQPPREVVGEPRVRTALPGRRDSAYDSDRCPGLRDDRRARHLAERALGRVGDPQWPTDVTNGARDPPAIAR